MLLCHYGPIHLQASSEAEADSELAWFYRPIYRPSITGQLSHLPLAFLARLLTISCCGRVDLVALGFVVVGIPHPIRPVVKEPTIVVIVITGLEKKVENLS